MNTINNLSRNLLKYAVCITLCASSFGYAENKTEEVEPNAAFNKTLMWSRVAVTDKDIQALEAEVAVRINEIYPELASFPAHEKVAYLMSNLNRGNYVYDLPISGTRMDEIIQGKGDSITQLELDTLTDYFQSLKNEMVNNHNLPERALGKDLEAAYAHTLHNYNLSQNNKQNVIIGAAVAGIAFLLALNPSISPELQKTANALFSTGLFYSLIVGVKLGFSSRKTTGLMRKFKFNYIRSHPALAEVQQFISYLKISGLSSGLSSIQCLRVYQKN